MATVLTETENELIELYIEKAFQAYQSGKLSEAARCAQRILDFDPEDANALFLKGATIGRASKPGKLYIEQAFGIWKPLVNRLTGDDKALMVNAISHAFAMMTETPVMLGFRFWSSYHSLETICSLRDVLQELLRLSDALIAAPEDAWITPLFRANYVTWVYDVVGADLAVPTGCDESILDAFYDMAHALYELAKRMPLEVSGAPLLRRRTLQALANFEERNHRESHPERRAYLIQEQKNLS